MAADPPEEPAKVEERPPTTPSSAALLDCHSSEEIKANSDPGVWAVLTAISKNARQRPQGMNIILTGDQHCIGRLVDDHSFRISDIAISGSHCRIFRGNVTVNEDEVVDSPVPAFLKDTSTNGTFLNWSKLRKSSPEVRLQHGDIISFLGPPHEEKAFAFVFREVSYSLFSNGAVMKRKTEMQFTPEGKRVKGIGIGAPEGPISLDDVRSLQRSNTALRKQLESHVLTIENMHAEARTSISHHENEIKELRESLSNSYLDQINELRQMLGVKQKELDDVNTILAEHQQSLKDLNERLTSSVQSCAEADEIIKSQKGTILEREAQLDEERNQRRAEREKAAADLKSALQRVQLEAQEEIKRQTDVYLQQHREQQEFIVKLQDFEKESRFLVETLRSKLEETRDNLVTSEKKARQLEALLQEEQTLRESHRKRSETLELEVRRLKGELESEKQVAREEAWAKVSALELEIAAVIRELSTEKQRFQGARERLILRETQLRAFYSTTEEISALFTKQQEQLKAMQRALEDDDDDCDGALACETALQGTPRRNSPAADSRGGDEDCTQDMEHVPETESPGQAEAHGEGGDVLGETMQLEDDAGGGSCSQLPVRTADLLASEGLGSWANSTAPSVHGENDSPQRRRRRFDASQNDATFPIPSVAGLHEQFSAGGGGKGESISDAETEEGGDSGGDEDDSGGSIGSGDLVMIQDSVG
ncbi:unnamed protein product [Spirodela intermedia]|uniref:FHA domain-containing protein n=1 Tax=Spirodela intermedia TaxID=51605 RepID=A0A7I8JVX7_SPIIN|nr:unnamed protein product [Spirodela intermedia]CAA6673612.1 unnamed protein product [Spirodela intermedia]